LVRGLRRAIPEELLVDKLIDDLGEVREQPSRATQDSFASRGAAGRARD
jgi:hypothetical protein